MNIKVTMNHSALNQLIKAQIQALEMTTEALKTDVMTSAVTPKDTGELERSAFIDNSKLRQGKSKLAYSAIHASRLYFHPEYDFRTDKNRNAQGKWLNAYIDGSKSEFAQKAFRRFFKQLSGGVVK